MRIRRGFLFWGLFLIPLGALPLLVQAGYLRADLLRDVWRWWPLVLVGLGVALILGRRGAGLIGTVLVALVLGTMGGAALASGNLWVGSIGECAGPGGDMTPSDASGEFSGPASVTLDLDCGTMDLTTEPGFAWRLHAESRGDAPRVQDSSASLSISDPDRPGPQRQEWDVTVGAEALRELDLTLNAGTSSATLAGADLARLRADMNAGDLLLDAGDASVARLDASVNAGRLRITLGTGATTGDLSVNAGAIELCVLPTAALRFEVEEQLTFVNNLASRGLTRNGDIWTRDGSEALIDLEIDGNAAGFTLDPDGGCK